MSLLTLFSIFDVAVGMLCFCENLMPCATSFFHLYKTK